MWDLALQYFPLSVFSLHRLSKNVFNNHSKCKQVLTILKLNKHYIQVIKLEVTVLKNAMKIRHTLPVNSNVSLKWTFSCKWFATNLTSEGLLTYQKEISFLNSTFHQYIKNIFYFTIHSIKCALLAPHASAIVQQISKTEWTH